MSGVIRIEISETVDELKELLKSTENQKVKERIQALYWLKSEQAKTTVAIASLVGRHRTTVSNSPNEAVISFRDIGSQHLPLAEVLEGITIKKSPLT